MKRMLMVAVVAGAALAALPLFFSDKSQRAYQGWVRPTRCSSALTPAGAW